ncbi:peptidoglycan editing factor PgeF [Qipengyuania flava]|nr:peptidoglycan editing factor PgeF [Qipengyuania flava]
MRDILRSRALDGIPHGFSTRDGFEAEDILANSVPVRVTQVHSAHAVVAEAAWDIPPEADAIVTATGGLALAIVTADCAPVLLSDNAAGVVAAAHAGWRGALEGVLENTVDAMCRLGAQPASISAAIGPTIAQSSYEVDGNFRTRLAEADHRFLAPGRTGHWQFDLPGYVAERLRTAGVGRIDDLSEDTYAQPDRFYSFRRATHRGEDTGGRQISMVALPR